MRLNVTSAHRNNDWYELTYQAESDLPFVPHDIILIQSEHYFIGTIKELHPEKLSIYISPQYESQLIATLEIELAFSPLISIEGASELIKELGAFPGFQYEKITSSDIGEEQVTFTIELPQPEPTHAVTFTFMGVKDQELTAPDSENVIFQLDFRYDGADMLVDIDAVTGLSGYFMCRGIRAELAKLKELT